MGKLFGTDGIRGEANVAPMTPDMALKLGRALGAMVHGTRNPRIVIGKDTRRSGYLFEQALAAGIHAMGADVWFTGPLPTPGIAFIARSLRADAGVVISASHNPYYDNGIKLFGRDGFKLPDEMEERLERDVLSDRYGSAGLTRDQIGRAHQLDEAWARYVEFLKAVLPNDLQLDGMKVVVDCAHGAAYKVAPAVFAELGADVEILGNSPNGFNINDGYGSLHPEKMAAAVRATGADLGIALDGDADRVLMCDEYGNVLDGDQLMAINALHMKETGELRKNTVVATVMSNLGLELALKGAGIDMIRTAVGDRSVVAEMRRGGFSVGGEQSGHLIFLDHATTGDGVVAALKTIEVMKRSGRPLSELARSMERVPQVLVNIRVASKPEMVDLPEVSKLIAVAEQAMGDEGRVLVRYSGTEPKARIMVEGVDTDTINSHANAIADALRRAIGSTEN